MPLRKRLEDELRSVWAEWSTPHDYGLWHDHTVPGPVEAAEEAVGLIKGQEDAPAPIEVAPTSSSSARGGAAESSAAVGGGGSAAAAAAAAADATPATNRKAGDPTSPEAKLASAFLKKKVAVGSVKATLLNLGARRTAAPKPPETDVPVITHTFIQTDLQKGLVSSPVQGLLHKTKQVPSGYPVHVMRKKEDGPTGYKYFWYTDKAGSLRILRGAALSKAIKTMEELRSGAQDKKTHAQAAELRKRKQKE
jgi:hypothetical protein